MLGGRSTSAPRILVFATGALVAVLLVIPSLLVMRDTHHAIAAVRREGGGLLAAREAVATLRLLQMHRGRRYMGGSAEAAARDTVLTRYGVELTSALERLEASVAPLDDKSVSEMAGRLKSDWDQLEREHAAGLGPEESFARHTALVEDDLALLGSIGMATGLSLHPEVAGNYLDQAALRELPRVTEVLGQMRARGSRLLMLKSATSQERRRVTVLAGEIDASLRNAGSDLSMAIAAAPDLEAVLQAPVARAFRAVSEARSLSASEVVTSPRLTMDPTTYFMRFTGYIDAQFSLIGAALTGLKGQLDLTEGRLQQRQRLVVGGFALLLVFCLGALGLLAWALAARRESLAQVSAILNAAPDTVIVTDESHRVLGVNRAAVQLYRGTDRDLVGRSITDLIPSETIARFEDDPAASGRSRLVTGRRVDGSTFPGELTRSQVELARGRRTVLVLRDISDRRNLELQLRQSQKMEAIGQLTGGIAHDFNNLLGIIVGNLDLLRDTASEGSDALALVDVAQHAALRGADLTRRLLAFARNQHLQPVAIRLPEAIASFVAMASRTLGPDVKIVTDVAPDTPPVFADPGELDNVLLNLAVNARDAMPGGGTLTIRSQRAEVEPQDAVVLAGDLLPGTFALINVSDTGHGIPPDRIERIFEPFYTTKEAGKGTGLGLAMVYGFVKQSGGNVKVYSEVGVGTTISMLLPVAQADAQTAATPRGPVKHRARSGATALVVDDQADLLEVAARFLASMGYRVLRASDGPSALRVLETEPIIDLLMTDIMMPGGMNGVQVAREVRRLRPDARIIYTSGFPAQSLLARPDAPTDGPLLGKPFLRRDFVELVEHVMQGEPDVVA